MSAAQRRQRLPRQRTCCRPWLASQSRVAVDQAPRTLAATSSFLMWALAMGSIAAPCLAASACALARMRSRSGSAHCGQPPLRTPRAQQARHASGEACAGQRAVDGDALAARQHARQVLRVPRRAQFHRRPRFVARCDAARLLPCLVPACPAQVGFNGKVQRRGLSASAAAPCSSASFHLAPGVSKGRRATKN